MNRAEEAITELKSLYEKVTDSDIPQVDCTLSSDPELLANLEYLAIKEVQEHIKFQARLCRGLLEMLYRENHVDCMEVLGSIEDIDTTTKMWDVVLSTNPRMYEYVEILRSADKSFSKFMGAIAMTGFIIVMNPVEGVQ